MCKKERLSANFMEQMRPDTPNREICESFGKAMTLRFKGGAS